MTRMNKKIKFLILINTLISSSTYAMDLKSKNLYNQTAYITSQCYTKTVNSKDENILHNPCFSCHTKNKEPNFTMQDEDLQEAYDFPSSAYKNPWSNLFKDRSKEVSNISDIEILNYIRKDNYKTAKNEIILKNKLENLSDKWDFNGNGKWDGYIPDVYFNFDNEGFDKDTKGKYTGWRAFAYYPFLGTFWPTNGSTDDVLIRLDKVFMQDENSKFDKDVYKLNLSIIESLIKQKTIEIERTDEKKYKIDLNKNGKLDFATKIVYEWTKPVFSLKNNRLTKFSMSYVGLARLELIENKQKIAPGLYPVNTEFLHSVRYVDIDKKNKIKMSSRMKELRYAKKSSWNTYAQLTNIGYADLKEKHDFPDRTDVYQGNLEIGISNKRGWKYQGFIEDKKGELRPQSYEETLYCIGCHSNIGVIADSTFVFQRKFEKDDLSHGWYHWSQKGLENIKDRKLANGDTEYVNYLKTNNAGDEFRQNEEIMEKFFTKNWEKDSENIQRDLIKNLENENIYLEQTWKLKEKEINKVKNDISHLILPSKKRAISLNKAYKVIVNEQSFIYGRDAHVKPTINVHKNIEKGEMTHLQKVVR